MRIFRRWSLARLGRIVLLLSLLVCLQLILTGPQTITAATAGPTLAVNPAAGRLAINPDIYGVTLFWSSTATTKAAQLAYANAIKLPLNRNGGDATTRYNWQVDSSNAGLDWFYMGGNGQTTATPGASMDAFVDTNRNIGSKSVLTIPTIQYVNKSSPWHCSFPQSVYGTQQSYNPYIHPNNDNCGNGVNTGGQNIPDTHVSDHDIPNTTAIQQAWVQHLKDKYGTAGQHGIIYQLDNEPHNWSYMHRDVHPNNVTESEIIQQNIAYAAAIKQTDPTAWVAGPSEIQFAWYFEFANDPGQQNPTGQANNIQYLQAMQQYQQQHGTRLIDSFDVHYPDANDNHYPNLTDIDRLKSVVGQYYPGTRISISEWTGGSGINGALFTADELGIYARNNLAFASYWGLDVTSPAAYAYKMYRNYDGSGSQFGDTHVQSSTTNAGQLAVHAAQRTSDGAVTIMVVNKTANDLTSPLNLSGFTPTSTAKVYRYSSANLTQIVAQSDQAVTASGFTVTYPANSITLLVLAKAPVKPAVPHYSASPIQSGNVFWLGAAKPTATRQNAFTIANQGDAGSLLTVSASALTGANASKFSFVNASDFPLSLGANQSHPVTLSCTPAATGLLSASLTFTTNDQNHANTAFTYTVKCSGGYVVTVASDDGSPNTLSQILSQQAVNPGDAVVFALPANSNNLVTVTAGISLAVKPGVIVDGGCTATGPVITVDGGGHPGSFTLKGNNQLIGLNIKNFGGPQLVTQAGAGVGGNYLSCVKAHKS